MLPAGALSAMIGTRAGGSAISPEERSGANVDQVEPGSVGSVSADRRPAAGGAGRVCAADSRNPGRVPEAFHGRAVSWVAVSLIMVAFLIGGSR